jgi:hypothetical protein
MSTPSTASDDGIPAVAGRRSLSDGGDPVALDDDIAILERSTSFRRK